ncbi:hypothetical protein Snoj_26940 [Streptomyces nojiriensis]|uniref:Secreted protein n=1 Tax=Streptomyces nojiriensis TaxID=66374 RepID=A0ABQ3SKW9_9ACTN|nr:hypothetical protein [Streptomyces nojiriensis]QTI42420.1 hypothetical protein JYK04_00177 [Streptomyces nojiriensis]GGS32258.1 hypothetical protein GCM10010205_73020 [Streptomyces nojiriensis]GHI68776.1 hypothetical protein Snoj_26940 [Streptomyces nojiriensis]
MGGKGVRRTAASAALAGAAALVLAAPPPAGAEPGAGTAPPSGTAAARQDASPAPPAPRLPRDFRGRGKWIVRDLDITVPFTWEGREGDSQMTAGGPQYPIWFTNLIYHDTLYTLTYKWPGLDEHPCSRIPGFSLEDLNQGFANARFVGPETLRRTPQRRVNHWRVGVVFPELPPGNYPRLPLALGDVYVDENDRGTFWQVLQFGVQNLYDPELDEWLVMDTFEHRPGTVTLPRRCEPPR